MPVKTTYSHDAVTDHAVRLHRAASGLQYDFVAAMREEFPGITDAALKRAIDEAKLTVAFGAILNREI